MKLILLITALLLTFTCAKDTCIDDIKLCKLNILFGLPTDYNGKLEHTLCRNKYALGYDYDNKIALWVFFLVKKEQLTDTHHRNYSFRQDACIAKKYSAKSSYYTNYNKSKKDNEKLHKGHIASVATVGETEQDIYETFFYTNIIPQYANFNTNNGIWYVLEKYERELLRANNGIDELYILSGPIFTESNKKFLYKNDVIIPDAFFKILYDIKRNKAISFILPHEIHKLSNLETYIESIDTIEERTELDFFKDLDDEIEKKLEATKEKNLWK